MARVQLADLKKTIYYLKRNGLRATWTAARERMRQKAQTPYQYQPPAPEELDRQRKEQPGMTEVISIVVPAYRTKEEYLRELIDSLLAQTYPYWELILADSTEDDSVERVAQDYEDGRIHYVRLAENAGISENTNRALEYATGSYIGLLDHDDLLTEDALYRMAEAIARCRKQDISVSFLYSDEDKCDQTGISFFEPNRKEDLNLDLLLTNHYICHFLVMESALIKGLGLRREYDGAQDYDLVLRAVAQVMREGKEALMERIVHIPDVLYHWRCHVGSTSENPQSKTYAYEAGRRAVQDFICHQPDWKYIEVEETAHVGFYRMRYIRPVFDCRPDLGAMGGKVVASGKKDSKKGSLIAGRYGADGKVYYEGTPRGFSGYMNRVAMQQDAYAVDLRCIRVRPGCRALFEEIVGVPYEEEEDTGLFAIETLPGNADIRALSVSFGAALQAAGYRILWDPALCRQV